MRADPESIAIARATMDEVRARARGRCEECGAPSGSPQSMIEGLPRPENTLNLCDACTPRLFRELDVADARELHRRIADKIERARLRP